MHLSDIARTRGLWVLALPVVLHICCKPSGNKKTPRVGGRKSPSVTSRWRLKNNVIPKDAKYRVGTLSFQACGIVRYAKEIEATKDVVVIADCGLENKHTELTIWSATGQLRKRIGLLAQYSSFFIDRDNKLIVLGNDKMLKILDLRGNIRESTVTPDPQMKDAIGNITSYFMGAYLVTKGTSLWLYRPSDKKWELLHNFKSDINKSSLVKLRQAKYIIIAGSDIYRLRMKSDGASLHKLSMRIPETTRSIALSPNGKWIAILEFGHTDVVTTTHLGRNVSYKYDFGVRRTMERVSEVAISDDAHLFVGRKNGDIDEYSERSRSGRTIYKARSRISLLAQSLKGQLVFGTASGKFGNLVRKGINKWISKYRGKSPGGTDNHIACGFSSEYVLTGSTNGTIKKWRPSQELACQLRLFDSEITKLHRIQRSGLIAAGSENGEIAIADMDKCKIRKKLQICNNRLEDITKVDNRAEIVAICEDGQIAVVNTILLKITKRSMEKKGSLQSVAYSPVSDKFIIAGTRIAIYDIGWRLSNAMSLGVNVQPIIVVAARESGSYFVVRNGKKIEKYGFDNKLLAESAMVHSDVITSLGFLRSNDKVTTSSYDGKLVILRSSDLKVVEKMPLGWGPVIDVCYDGRRKIMYTLHSSSDIIAW